MKIEKVDWNMISALGGWASAIATLLTLFVAFRALTTWREQEKIKVKMEFKKALMTFKSTLILMPEYLSIKELAEQKEAVAAKWIFKDVPLIMQDITEGESNVLQFESFILSYENCNSCWVATEHLFDKHFIAERWNAASSAYFDYLAGKVDKHKLFDALNAVFSVRFVFEHK